MQFEIKLRDPESIEAIGEIVSSLERALRTDRAAILLAIYKSSITRLAAELAIANTIDEKHVGYSCLRITSPKNSEIPIRALSLLDQETKIHFISGWQWGGEKAFRILNIRREQLIDEAMKAIFWLTENEARKLPTAAPDFWSFRHRVFKLNEIPGDQFLEPAKYDRHDFIWSQLDMSLLRSESIIQRDLAWRQRNLRKLPDDFSSYLTRGQQNYVLSALYWAENKYVLALMAAEEAKDYADRIGDKRRRAAVQVGLGHIACGMEQYEQALEHYDLALHFSTNEPTAFIGRGNAYRLLGQFSKADITYRQGLRQTPDDAGLLSGLGKVYLAEGRDEEAVSLFQLAITSPPPTRAAFDGLAQAYRRFGQIELAQQIERKALAFEKDVVSLKKSDDRVPFLGTPALAS